MEAPTAASRKKPNYIAIIKTTMLSSWYILIDAFARSTEIYLHRIALLWLAGRPNGSVGNIEPSDVGRSVRISVSSHELVFFPLEKIEINKTKNPQ